MKKLLALLLAVVMVLSLFAACGSKDDEDEDEEEKETVSKEKNEEEEASDEQEEQKDDEEEEEKEEEEKKPAKKEFSLGEVSGRTYENDFIGIGCRLPAGWTYLDEEELKEMNNISAELLGDDLLEAYAKASAAYAMMATSGSVENCNLNVEKVAQAKLDALDIVENYEKLLPMMEQMFENMGAENIVLEITTVKLDGKTFDCMHSSLTLNGVDMVQYTISMKCDGYMANLALTATDDEGLEEILDCFYLLK